MDRPPLLHDRPVWADKRVLLIDRCQVTREARCVILRSHGVKVQEAEELSTARLLWHPNFYDLVMLDVQRYSSEVTREFYEQIKEASPRQQFAFLIGSPGYLSRTWPIEVASDDTLARTMGTDPKALLAAA